MWTQKSQINYLKLLIIFIYLLKYKISSLIINFFEEEMGFCASTALSPLERWLIADNFYKIDTHPELFDLVNKQKMQEQSFQLHHIDLHLKIHDLAEVYTEDKSI